MAVDKLRAPQERLGDHPSNSLSPPATIFPVDMANEIDWLKFQSNGFGRIFGTNAVVGNGAT